MTGDNPSLEHAMWTRVYTRMVLTVTVPQPTTSTTPTTSDYEKLPEMKALK